MLKALKKKFSYCDTPVTDYIIIVLLAFISTFQVGYLLSLATPFGAAWGIAVTCVFAGTVARLVYFAKFVPAHDDGKVKRRMIWSLVLAFVLALTYVLGYQLQYVGYTAPGFKGKFLIGMHGIGFLPLIAPLFYFLLYFVDHTPEVKLTGKAFYRTGKIFFFAWAFIFISWIPAFLA